MRCRYGPDISPFMRFAQRRKPGLRLVSAPILRFLVVRAIGRL